MSNSVSRILKAEEDAILEEARYILKKRLEATSLREVDYAVTSPQLVIDFLKMKLALEEREVFHVCFLDNQHKVLKSETMFEGTINRTTVHPREILKAALECNAAAVILSHNHPSGNTVISAADKAITKAIREALAMIDVNLLDHIIIAGDKTVSLAQKRAL